MFFFHYVRSHIASRLRPWLVEEPELELQLGLLSSHGCARNLVFDTSSLNPLIEDSTRLEFKRAEVGELHVRFRPWSSPSIHVEVRRLRVILALRETSKPQFAISDLTARKKKVGIASLDPEGASLHDAIERILARDITGDRLMASWGDVLASCSLIKFSDISFELQTIDKSNACLLEMDECFINSQFLQGASLFRQFLGSLFLPGKGCGLSIGFNTLRFGLKENDQINWITSLSGLSAHVKLIRFHPLSNYIHAPLIDMKLSPDVFPLLMLMLDALSSKKHGGVRTGKELWRTAANKIGHLTSGARSSLHNVVEMVVLWSRYVSTYNSLLTTVGCSAEVSLKGNVGMDSIDKNIIKQARHQLGLIFELEQKLPAHMVVQARKIARNKRPLTDPKRSMDFSNALQRKILALFWFLWQIVWFIFQALSHFSFWKDLNLHYGIQRVTKPGDDQSSCFCFEEVFITCSHSAHAHFPISKDIGRDAMMNLPSFGLILRQLYLTSRTDVSKGSFFMALGEIKLCLVPLHVHLDSELTIKRIHSSKTVHPGGNDELKVILKSDSALLCHPQVTSNDDSLKPFFIILKNNTRDLWSNLKKNRGKQEANILHDEQAFLICELKSFITDPYTKNGGHGLWKYSLNVGKVTVDLDYSSILLASLIFKQMDDHSQRILRAGRTSTISFTSSMAADKSGSGLEDTLEIYANQFVGSILNLIPVKNIHVGVLLAGFCIRVSLEDRFSGNNENDITRVIAQGNNCHWIKIDIGNTEFVTWPASKAVLAAITSDPYFEKIPQEYLWLMEPRKFNAHEEGTTYDKFISRGCITLNACLRFNVVNASSGFELTKHSHIAEPISITTKASICRDYYHSFDMTTDALSVALTVITSSAAVLFYVDELRNLFQLFEGMLLELPASYNIIGSDGLEGSHKLVRNSRDELCSISTDDGMNLQHTLLLMDATFELEPVDLILGESRKAPSTGIPMHDDSSSCNLPYLSPSPTKKEILSSDVLELPGFGLGFSIHKSCVNLSLEAHSVNVLFDLSGFQTVLIDHQSLMRISNDMLQIKNIPSESLKHRYQFYLTHCMLKLHVSLHCGILCCSNCCCVMHSLHSANCRTSWVIEESHHGNGSPSNPLDGDHEFEYGNLHSTGTHGPASGFSLVVDVGFGCIVVSDYHGTSLFNRTDQPYELRISIFVGEGLHSINCKIQGGSIFLEALALTKFLHCFLIYSLLIASFPRRVVHASREALVSRFSGNNLATPDLPSSKEHLSGSLSSASSTKIQQTARWDFIDTLTIDLTEFSLTLAVASSSGKADKLIIELDVLLRFMDFGRRIIMDLHRLDVFTQNLRESILNKNEEMQVLHFRSQTTIASDSQIPSKINSSQDPDSVSSDSFSAQSLASPTFKHEESNGTSDSFCHRHSLLKHMTGSVTMEKVDLEDDRYNMEFNSNWVGKGSISGLNLIIKFSDIQMFLALYALFSETFPVETSDSDMQNVSLRNSVWSADSGYNIPDGAVIAIQDLQQHMYFAVEAVGDKYHLAGTLHYFLTGERALFKVRYHKSWWLRMPCMSFISLYAKNNKGEPLCLNFNPRSGFVGISGTDGSGSSLWQTFFHESGNFEEEEEVMKYTASRKGFHLVNLKNDSAVAFIDGMPEFVKKPGNQFKVKLFDGSQLVKGITGYPFKSSDNGCDKHHKGESSISGEGRSEFYIKLPHVNIAVDNATITIIHDVSDVDDQLPLFRCSLDNTTLLGQIVSTKLRIFSSFSAVLHHFDSRMNIWREVVAPVDMWLFYRSRFTQADSLNGDHGVPVHFFLRMGLVDISLTEVSLDILLYFINKLDLAGPYAVRRSVIFPNSCKLENCTGLSVLYQFSKNQNLVLSRGQSSSIFLRSGASADRLPVSENSVSISLSDNEGVSTSPMNIPLSKPCLFAWRTRIVSSKDSTLFPGPFVVVDVAQKDEEGLSVTVLPLLRIHNESKFPMELCFQRPEEAKTEYTSILLKSGDSVDDSRAVFDALDFCGGSKRTLLSLTLGNFLLSLRPQITENLENNEKNICFCWSEEIKGGKALRISGIFDKLNYSFRKALGVGSLKSFFSTLCCPITIEGQHASGLHFLIQTITRDVPVMQPQNVGNAKEARSSLVAMQVQKEIFIHPTVLVYNLLQSEIFVLLSENHPDMCIMEEVSNFGRQATIPSQSNAYLYANPANIYFRITLNAYGSTSKPVNSGDWVKKLERKRSDTHFIDIELEFGGGSGTYFAALRLSRSDRGLLEATIFTTYTFQNSSEITLFCSASSQKSCSWDAKTENCSSDIPPELGCLLPPTSMKSWFLKSTKVHVKWLEEKTSMALVDLDILSGFTELSLEAADDTGINRVAKIGVSLQPCVHKEVFVPTHVVSFVPRFVIVNESKESIVVRQCYLQGDVSADTVVEARQKVPLHIRKKACQRREKNLFDSVFRSHSSKSDETQIFVQFCTKEVTSQSWSGPICIASLGRFFLKFKGHSVYHAGSSNLINLQEKKSTQFAVAHIVDERSSLILYFYMPPDIPLPYRIENFLQGVSIKYYQKDSAESEILPSGASTEYVWDDLSLPHRLVVEILDFHLMREINFDKICEWKPFFKMRQHRGLLLHLPLNKQSKIEQRTLDEPYGTDIFKLGFEVYADGSARVLRLCESTRRTEQKKFQPSRNFQLRLSTFAMHFLEIKQVEDFSKSEPLNYVTIIVARLGNVSLDSLITRGCKYNYLKVQSFTVDEKWQGAPFASMVRRSQLHDSEMNMNILHFTFVLQSTNSRVKQVKYCSVVLQPVDLKIDEETLMKLVPFWRSSNNNTVNKSQQFYFKHFEIHPVKLTASFLPGNQYPGYNSAQQALRSLLHSVLKVPSISNVVLELNGVLVTHALVTSRELLIKCAQHYSWYLVRAVYISKGSSLLPPAFASIFDDTASSSLDVFFDPSDGSISLPGLTLGMFKIISKCINAKGFSGTRRYFGDLGKTMKAAGSNVLFAAVTEISDNVLRGAESSGFNGLVTGFHQGILRLAMEPSLLGAAVMEGGPDRKIKLDRSPGVDELYIEGYLQAMLEVMYKQEFLRVRVIDNQVLLKNLPPNSSVINDILENVKSVLVSKALLKGDTSASSLPLRHLKSENDWKLGPTVLTLCEHLFVSFTVRMLRKQANKFIAGIKWKGKEETKLEGETSQDGNQQKASRTWAVGKFFFSGMIAYLDGRLCRHIPNPLVRRIVSGFMLSYLDKSDGN